MSLVNCPDCSRQVSDSAPACPGCGRPMHAATAPTPAVPPPKRPTSALTKLIVFVVCLGGCGLCIDGMVKQSDRQPAESPPVDTSKLTSGWDDLLKLGVVQKVEGHDVYVNALLWNGVNIDAKRGMAVVMRYHVNGRNDGWVNVYDYRTGKKLAKLNSWGFSLED